MKNQYKIMLLVLSLFTVLAACGDEDPGMQMEQEMEMKDNCEDVDASYKDDIVGIFSASCAITGCHVEGFDNGDFTSYNNVSAGAASIKRRAVDQGNMPPANSSAPELTDTQKQLLSCWIENGALDN